jgi:hypothetical protein
MRYPTRRRFLLQLVTGAGVAAAGVARAGAAEDKSLERVLETDSYPKSMGFKYDTNQVDNARWPRHDAATQQCSKCQLYSGAPGDELGRCSFFKPRKA